MSEPPRRAEAQSPTSADTRAAPGAPGRHAQSFSARLLPWLIAAIAAAVYILISLRQWAAYDFPSWDLGIFAEAAKGYSRGGPPIVSIKGDHYNLLGDHFHPVLALTGPLWALWPSPLMLLVLQAVLLAISAVPLTRLATERLGLTLGILLGVGYAFSWGIQAAHAVQFHEIAFAVPMLALSLTALIRERYRAAAIWAGLLITVKEDLGLTVIMVGAVIAWRGWHGGKSWRGGTPWRSDSTIESGWRGERTARRPRSDHAWRTPVDARTVTIGAALAAWGAAWTVLSMLVILPALSPEGQFEYTDNVGSLLEAFVPGTKWITVLLLILAMGVVGLRSPIWLLMLPTLAWRFTGTVEFYWGWTWHYSAVLMPVAAAALLDALREREPGRGGESGVDSEGGRGPGRRFTPKRTQQVIAPAAVAALLASTLIAHLLGPALPITQLTDPITARQQAHRAAADDVIAALPRTGPLIAADISVMAPAVPHADVQWIHGPNQLTPECALIDLDAFSWNHQPPADRAAWLRERYQAEFTLVTQSGRVELWCRGHQPTRTGQR